MYRYSYKLTVPIAAALFLSGCAVAKVSMPYFTATMARGYYEQAAEIARGEIGMRNTYHDLLWTLQAGSMERLVKNYAASNRYFEAAEDSFRYWDRQGALGQAGQASRSLAFNDSALPYGGRHYDRIMVNTYKALNDAALGDRKKARIEFNRALVRQDEAKAFFAAEVERLKEERGRRIRSSGTGSDVVEATLNNPDLDKIINEHYKNLDAFKAYRDFVNPFTSYMAGLYFWLEGDRAKAVDLLKEAYGMIGDNPAVSDSFTRAARGEQPSGEIWVIFENGLAPQRKEMRIDIPVFLVSRDVVYVGTAFPNLGDGNSAYDAITVTGAGGKSVSTAPLSSMAAVIAQEFRKELPMMTVREVSRVALKTYFQYQMFQNYGFLAGLAGAIYQAGTTAVDVRSWSALPDNFQAAHMKIPAGRTVTLQAGETEPVTINIPPEINNVILYVRAVASGVPPVYDLIKF